MVEKKILIQSESEFKKWFVENYKKLGYSMILRKDIGEFPDFIMLKNKKKVKVELETLSSHFILHKHDIHKVDEIVCIIKDKDIDNIIVNEIPYLTYESKITRISATIDKETEELIDFIVKNSYCRNQSHAIELAIQILGKEVKNGKYKK